MHKVFLRFKFWFSNCLIECPEDMQKQQFQLSNFLFLNHVFLYLLQFCDGYLVASRWQTSSQIWICNIFLTARSVLLNYLSVFEFESTYLYPIWSYISDRFKFLFYLICISFNYLEIWASPDKNLSYIAWSVTSILPF